MKNLVILVCSLACSLILVTACSSDTVSDSYDDSYEESYDESYDERYASSPTVPVQYDGIIVAMGDSLTEGYQLPPDEAYPFLLEKKLLKQGYRYKVINAGISGETSSGALSRIEWVMNLQPDIIIVETGANDGLRGIDSALIESNIDKIISYFKAQNVQVILAGMQIPPNQGTDYVTEFAAIFPKLAAKHQIELIPFILQGVAGVRRLNLSDGIHPTAEGYIIVADNVYPYAVKVIESKK